MGLEVVNVELHQRNSILMERNEVSEGVDIEIFKHTCRIRNLSDFSSHHNSIFIQNS